MNQLADAPDRARRMILKGAVAGGLVGMGFTFGAPSLALAADAEAKDWPANAFKTKGEAETLKDLYGKTAEASDKVALDAPTSDKRGAANQVKQGAKRDRRNRPGSFALTPFGF